MTKVFYKNLLILACTFGSLKYAVGSEDCLDPISAVRQSQDFKAIATQTSTGSNFFQKPSAEALEKIGKFSLILQKIYPYHFESMSLREIIFYEQYYRFPELLNSIPSNQRYLYEPFCPQNLEKSLQEHLDNEIVAKHCKRMAYFPSCQKGIAAIKRITDSKQKRAQNNIQASILSQDVIPSQPKQSNRYSDKKITNDEEIGLDQHHDFLFLNQGDYKYPLNLASFASNSKQGFQQNILNNVTAPIALIELPNLSQYPKNLVYDQGDLGSCTANSMAFIIRYLSVFNSATPNNFVNNPSRLDSSRLFQYYNTRYESAVLQGQQDWRSYVKQDTGGSMAAAIIAIDKYGCCPEKCVYNLEKVNQPDVVGKREFDGLCYKVTSFADYPEPECFRFGLDNDYDGINSGLKFSETQNQKNPYSLVSQAIQYQDLTTAYRAPNSKLKNSNTAAEQAAFINSVTESLKNGRPFYVGIMLDDSFQTGKGGFIPTPNLSTFQYTGGHAICVVGYGPYNKVDKSKNYFKFINSWGPSWGDNGFGYLEQAYLSNINIFLVEGFSVWFDQKIWAK